MADLVLSLGGDKDVAAAWIGDLPELALHSDDLYPTDVGFSQETRFRFYRLQYWLGEVRDPDQLVAEDVESTVWRSHTRDSEKDDLRRVALMVATLAALWGHGRRGYRRHPSVFIHEVRWVLDLLHTSYRFEIADFLIRAAAEHGEEVVAALAAELSHRWDLGEWRISLRRVAIVALARAGAEERARELLKRLEGEMYGHGSPTDRTEEHWHQTTAWVELGDTDAARAELRRMVIDSRGLLDDHDYQSEVWVRWMGRANAQDPENTEERIQTMLRRLIAVGHDASGVTEAARELVATTFRWSPRRAVCLMKGLQEKGILAHDEALTSLLQVALEFSDPPVHIIIQTLVCLLLPLTNSRSTMLVDLLIESIAVRYGKDAAGTAGRYLVDRVRAEVISSDRQNWLEQIQRSLNRVNIQYSFSNTDELEVEDRENGGNSTDNHRMHFLEKDKRTSLMEARGAVEKSKPRGWFLWWDGGSRIHALQELQKIDPERGRAIAVRLYSEDLGGGLLSTQHILEGFDNVISLLFERIPELDLWTLLEDYLDDLYGAVLVEPVLDLERMLSKALGKEIHDTAAQGVADAIAAYLDHPSYVVTVQAMRISTAVLIAGSEAGEMQKALISAACRSEAAAERVLLILTAVEENQVSLKPFRKSLLYLMESENFSIRVQAARLVALLDDLPMNVPLLERELPGIYRLEIPSLSVHRTEEISSGTQDTTIVLNDPARALCPLDREARMIAKEAGVDEDTVLLRAARFLDQLGQDHPWITYNGQIDEVKVSQFLDKTHLRVSFHKPHIEPAWRAIARVAAELWDAGVLEVESAQRMAGMFFHHDPALILLEPQPRPSWIPSDMMYPDGQDIYIVPDGWMENAQSSIGNLRPRTPDDRVILGEFSRFANLGRDRRIEEDRASHIVASLEDKLWRGEGSELPFFSLFKLSVSGYANVLAPSEYLVIGSNSFYSHLPADQWLAFNPRIALGFGWSLSREGFFRWVDENGDLTVESIWWTDGGIDFYDNYKYGSVGNGWLVLATETAYSRLVGWAPCLSRGGLIRRRRGRAASGDSVSSRAVLSLP